MQIVQQDIESIDIEGCEISLQESLKMIDSLKGFMVDLRARFLEKDPINSQEEINFFKNMKPQLLSLLIYFNKIHSIELKRPNGSNEIQRDYYMKEQDRLTYFFDNNIDFYQYYRSNAIHLDEYYFLRGRTYPSLCVDSSQFVQDPLFSTGYDYKVSKILANEMLRIYLNKKLQSLEIQNLRSSEQMINANNTQLQWTAPKAAAIELGYALYASGVLNYGNIDIRDIMNLIEVNFSINLGDFYRAYITIKSRKKDRTVFLKMLIDKLTKRMDEDDMI